MKPSTRTCKQLSTSMWWLGGFFKWMSIMFLVKVMASLLAACQHTVIPKNRLTEGRGRTGHRRTGCNPVTSDDASVCPSASNGHSD